MSLPQRPPRRTRGAKQLASNASWIALVAATTFGLGQVDRLRTEVSAGNDMGVTEEDGTIYRLIVQSYDRNALNGNALGATARPLASAQRAVTARQLREGLSVDVVQVGAGSSDRSVVVAWVEQGEPDLEYDALRARPLPGAFYGLTHLKKAQASARVVLSHRAG